MKLFLITTILTIAIISNALGQYHEIKVGDVVPDFTFRDIYNSNRKVIHINDYKGKLVILDFWGTYCAPCLGAFPFLDSLQKEFSGRIQILTVAAISSDETKAFFKKHNHVFKPNIPFISSAKFMDTVFPHTGVPFQVWISPSGEVLLCGDPASLTRENIKKTLNTGKAAYRKASKNIYASFIDSRYKNLVLYASSICSYKSDSLRMQPELEAPGKHLFERGSIQFLYQRAFSDSSYKFLDVYSPGRVILNVENPDRYVEKPALKGEDKKRWIDENYFNYQLIEPVTFRGNLYEKMKADLDSYFQLTSRIEKRYVNSYVLISIGNHDFLRSKGGNGFNNFHKMIDMHSTETADIRYLKNQPFSYFTMIVRDFVEYNLNSPFFDESGIDYNVDLEMNGTVLDSMNFNRWQEALKRYNLALVKKSELIDVLVISDKK